MRTNNPQTNWTISRAVPCDSTTSLAHKYKRVVSCVVYVPLCSFNGCLFDSVELYNSRDYQFRIVFHVAGLKRSHTHSCTPHKSLYWSTRMQRCLSTTSTTALDGDTIFRWYWFIHLNREVHLLVRTSSYECVRLISRTYTQAFVFIILLSNLSHLCIRVCCLLNAGIVVTVRSHKLARYASKVCLHTNTHTSGYPSRRYVWRGMRHSSNITHISLTRIHNTRTHTCNSSSSPFPEHYRTAESRDMHLEINGLYLAGWSGCAV